MGWNTKYPIGRLVAKQGGELSIDRNELMKRLGYLNPTKGLRHFDLFLTTGKYTSHLQNNLPEVLGVPTAIVEEAVSTTRQQIEKAQESTAREKFSPHILVLTKGERLPFFIQAFIWGERLLDLPKTFHQLSLSQQVHQVAGIARRHFHGHRGKLEAWGIITGYRLQSTCDHAVILNTDGTILEGFNRDGETSKPELRVKGKRVSVGGGSFIPMK